MIYKLDILEWLRDASILKSIRDIIDEKDSHYHVYNIKNRVIAEPSEELAKYQMLVKEWFDNIPLHNSAHGFRIGRSIVTNAQCHIGQNIIVNMDIKKFFDSVNLEMIKSTFIKYSFLEEEIINQLSSLVEYKDKLPTGACSSPVISNVYLTEFDQIIYSFAEECNVIYTRYADDLTFSGSYIPERLISLVKSELEKINLFTNEKKFKVMRYSNQQIVTGIIVNEKLNISREQRNFLRGKFHSLGTQQKELSKEDNGLLSHIQSVNPVFADKLMYVYNDGLKKVCENS